jgi:WD40 repeat protein
MAQENADPTYEKDLRPLLKKHCTACHNGRKLADPEVSGGMALDTYEAIEAARARKAAIFSGGDKSEILQRLTSPDDEKRMPLGGEALAAADIALIRRWLDAGLKQGDPSTGTSTVGAETKTSTSHVRPVLFTTGFQIPKGSFTRFALKLQLQLPHGAPAPITALSYSTDGKTLAVGSYKQIVLWNLESVEPRLILADFPGAVHDLHFSSDGKLLLVAGGLPAVEGLAWIYDLRQSKWTKKIQAGQDVITGAAFDPAGRTLALGNSDKKIYLCTLETGVIERTLTGHSDGVTAVAYTPDGQWLLSTGKDRACKITSASTGRTKLTLTGSNDEELALAIHPSGQEAVSSGLDSSISCWDLTTGKRVRRLRGHGIAVNGMAFDRSGNILASAGSDKTVHLWNGKNGANLRTLITNTRLFAVAIQPDGSQVSAGGMDGSTMIWNVPSGRLLLTLSAFRDSQGIVQWLVYIPEGYVNASPGAKESIVWKTEGGLTQSAFWTLLERPNQIVRAAHGEQIGVPGTGPSR